MASRRSFICLASTKACDERFATLTLSKIYAQDKHNVGLFPCPLTTELDCLRRFYAKTPADKHALDDHGRGKAKADAKGKAKADAKGKAKDDGKGKVTDDKEGKAKDNSKGKAKDNAKGKAKDNGKGESTNVPCPTSETIDCTAIFSSTPDANRHAQDAHNYGIYTCPRANDLHCLRRFALKDESMAHA